MKRDLTYHRKRAEEFVSNLSLEDKMTIFHGKSREQAELGLYYFKFAGEAAHGVQARHDQNFDYGEPQFTTIFSCPIGMAASFDKEMMRNIGNVVGTEMRSLLNEHLHNGLCGLAPTVDMERDPRWGRNEEAYGEDPHLVSRMGGEYIRGIAGNNENFIQCASTLKHFYGNNVEHNRFVSDTKISDELRENYYLRVFKEIIEYGQPMSVMTSYNLVNGVPSTFNPEAKNLLKKSGVPYIVSDAFTLEYAVEDQKTAIDGADAVRKAFDAGIDTFFEELDFEFTAMDKAFEKGLINEDYITEAITNKLTVYSILGLMPEDLTEDGRSKYFPLSEYNKEKVDTAESRMLARTAAAESVVLLKNEMLPISKEEEPFIFGPFSNRCPLDWYSGLPSHTVTLKEGLGAGNEDLYPYVRIRINTPSDAADEGDSNKGAMYAGISDGRVVPVSKEYSEIFRIMLWDNARITIRSTSTGKLLTTSSPECKIANNVEPAKEFILHANADEAFSWFVNEAFLLIDKEGKEIIFTEDNALNFWENDRIAGIKNTDGEMLLSFETLMDGSTLIEKAIAENNLKSDSKIIAAFGLHPIVNCKEERDRDTIELPPYQRAILRELRSHFDNITLTLLANAPVAITEEDEAIEIKSILWSAFGSEELGNGLADIIYGKVSPAGRLPQTWYTGDDQLPAIDDYDIKKNKMTYLYMTAAPLYRFGYGLTYSKFESELLLDGDKVSVRVTNNGNVTSDYTALIFQSEDGSYYLYGEDKDFIDVSGKEIPVGSRLVAFTRFKNIEPGSAKITELI